jgi:hypothetical protein
MAACGTIPVPVNSQPSRIETSLANLAFNASINRLASEIRPAAVDDTTIVAGIAFCRRNCAAAMEAPEILAVGERVILTLLSLNSLNIRRADRKRRSSRS